MACIQPLLEKRPLKRPRLGPPDFYPQDPKQSEDDLTPDKLRNGYYYRAPFPNEYESAKQPRLEEKLDEYSAKVVQSYNAITAKKNEINALQDAAKKKAGAMRDPYWHCAGRPKLHDVWFRDLAGSKPLTSLAKKFPFFNKKEDIFCTLSEFNIPMCRGIWFIKMTNAYFTQQQETGKIKKKQATDPCSEWTSGLTTFLRQLFSKLTDYYSPTSQTVLTADATAALKQWQYCSKLGRYMFEEGLLDKQEFLTWMLEVFSDKCRTSDEGALKLILPLIMQHLDGILRSELLSRKLTHLCCKKLSHFYIDAGSSSPGPPSPSGQTQQLWYTDYLNCPYHRTIVYSLSAIVQAVIIECPTALVWNKMEMNSANSESSKAFLCGSPLDILPCFPSQLPIPQGPAIESIVDELKRYESEVKRRSIAVDSHWSFDKCEQSGLGNMVSFILSTLEALDKHRYDRSGHLKTEKIDNTLDKLYSRVFPVDSKELEEGGETTIVKLLCHWAVTAHRIGPHRALVVVRLLEKRQNEIQQQMVADGDGENKNSSHYFQSALFEYLDTEAPTLEESSTNLSSKTNKVQFANLVLLFGELIRADLFSHDFYLRTLISRGDLTANSYQLVLQHNISGAVNSHVNNNLSSSSSAFGDQKKFEEHDFTDKETEEPKLDIDKLLATIDRPSGSDYQGRLEKPPLSVGSSYPGSVDPQFPPSVDSQAHVQPSSNLISNKPTSLSRHYYNVLHFPVPQDDQYKHESNQRQTLLFGCGSIRDMQKSIVRKVAKELNKLWHKKNSVECSNGGQLKLKRKINLATLKALTQRFRGIVFFDQHAIADSCADVCLDQIREFTSAQTNYLPNVENLDYFFGLYETSLNFSGLIEFIEAVVALLPKVEIQLHSRGCSSAGNYIINVAVCAVGYLTKHLAYLTFSNTELVNIWTLLFNLMYLRPMLSTNPSAERCIFGFLLDVYENCDYLRSECESMFAKIKDRVECCGFPNIKEATSGKFNVDPKYAFQYFEDPKKEIDDNFLRSLENPTNKYNFVSNAILALIAARRNTERLFDLARLCADVTSLCPSLAADWLGILKSLCCYKAVFVKQELVLPDSIQAIDLNDLSIHQPFAVLLVTLVGRRCIKMEDYVWNVAMCVLFPYLNTRATAEVKPEAESTARLILHCCAVLCLCLECGDDTIYSPQSCCRLKGELYLIASAHRSIVPQAILILLITLIFGNRSEEASASHESDFAFKNVRPKTLADYTNELLNHICQQEWIKNTFLQPLDLFNEGLLLHQLLKHTQAQKMLHMITRSSAESDLVRELEQCSSKKDLTSKILQNLSVWNLNVSLLDLELLLKQSAEQEHSCLADLIAKAAINLFQAGDNSFLSSSPKKNNQRNYNQFKLSDIKSGWLVAPLISKLPSTVQGKVLKAAALVLENGQLSRKDKSALNQSSSLLGQQPFLSLVLICLRGQDDQRETLLSSLLKQLQEYVQQAKSDKYQFSSRENLTENREALQLRLSLVGGMFDTVCKGSSIENWALLLLQLLLYGVITIEFDRQLFYTCVDMLTILIHSCLIPDASKDGTERTVDECRRLHNSVTKKLKKEIGERYIPALKSVHQLLPIPRHFNEVVACEPYGSQPAKSFKSGAPSPSPLTLDPNSRKGLQVTGKERISPWDLIEGYRGDNCGPKWSLFQAVKVDLQPDTVTNQLNRLVPHDHYHHFKRPPLPGENRSDPYLEPLPIQYDQIKLHELEKNARKDDSMTPVSQTGTDFADNLMSPTTKAALKAKKNAGGSTRGGRKQSRGAATVAAYAPNVMNVRGVGHVPMTPGPSMPMGGYPANPQQQMTSGMQPSASPYPQQAGGWSHLPPQQQPMMPNPQQPMTGYQPRGYPGSMVQPHLGGMAPNSRGALNARIRSRQPSGAVIMHEANHPVQVPRHQTYVPQHMVQPKVNEQYPNPNVQHQLQLQLEQHRQQLMNESMMEQQQTNRPPVHRHVPGTTVEHIEPMQQQQIQQMPSGYGAQAQYATGGGNRMPMVATNRQQSFSGGGYSNPSTNQNFGGQQQQQQQQQYYPGNAGGGGNQMRMPSQQNEMMGNTPRYPHSVNTGQMNYNMVAQQQQPSVQRNSGNYMMQQQAMGHQQQQAMGHQQQQAAMSHQQQQQMPMSHQQQVPMSHQQQQQQQQQQQPNQSYATGNPQHFQQNTQQGGQIYPIQRMPSYSNLQMEGQTQMNYYQQQQF